MCNLALCGGGKSFTSHTFLWLDHQGSLLWCCWAPGHWDLRGVPLMDPYWELLGEACPPYLLATVINSFQFVSEPLLLSFWIYSTPLPWYITQRGYQFWESKLYTWGPAWMPILLYHFLFLAHPTCGRAFILKFWYTPQTICHCLGLLVVHRSWNTLHYLPYASWTLRGARMDLRLWTVHLLASYPGLYV